MLPESIIKDFPEASSDFDEAGRCWLFDTYTAAGFHLMRATESVIREYYKVITGVDLPKKYRNWGAYIKNLKKCPNASLNVIGFLDHMRENYRNPIAHPEHNLSADDAQILFGVCVGAIQMMAAEIKTITSTGSLLPLTQTALAPTP